MRQSAVITLLALATICSACSSIRQPAGGDTPELVGKIPGDFSVSRNGSAVYAIPIAVPPGIRNMEPEMELVYRSQLRNGRVGVGWGLSGFSAVTRCPANFAVDGFRGGVQYDGDDRFCLDGSRLIVTVGTYGADQSQYRTELDSFKLVVARNDGSCGLGPCSFTVRTKRGTVMEYGAASGRIVAAGRPDVRVWALDTVTDLNGNRMAFRYTTDPLGSGNPDEDYYPTVVEYTANGKAVPEVGVNRTVALGYEARPDVAPRFQGGVRIVTSARLARITTFLGQSAVQEYRLDYGALSSPADGDSTGREVIGTVAQRSRLMSLALCDGSGPDAACLRKTSFAWQNSAARFDGISTALPDAFGVSSTQPYSAEVGLRHLADVNGDGRADIVGFSNRDGAQVALSQGATFRQQESWIDEFDSARGWSTERTPRLLADVDGDGRADVVGFKDDGVYLAYSTGARFSFEDVPQPFPFFGLDTGPAGPGWSPTANPRTLGDVNGDGRADIVGFKDGVWVATARRGERGFDDPRRWSDRFGGSEWSQQTPRLLTDVNGDGRADVLGFNVDGVHIALSDGERFVTPSFSPFPFFKINAPWSTTTDLLTIADVNGDGLADLVGSRRAGVFVALATGKGFAPPAESPWTAEFNLGGPQWSLRQTPLYFADINADGKADVIGYGLQGVRVGLSTGTAFETATWNQDSLQAFQAGPDWGELTPRRVVDVNGDGLLDALGFGRINVQVGLASQPLPDVVAAITDGLGQTVTITYRPISDAEVYSPTVQGDSAGDPGQAVAALFNNSLSAASPYPVVGATAGELGVQNLLGGRGQVVASYRLSNDTSLNSQSFDYQFRYVYAAGKIDLGGRGWLGYREVRRTEGPPPQQAGRVTVRTYDQSFPRTGKLASLVRRCGEESSDFDPRCGEPGLELVARWWTYEARVTATGTGPTRPEVLSVQRHTRREDLFDYGLYAFSLGQRWDYDRFGNILRFADLGYVDRAFVNLSASDDVYTLSSYLPPPAGVPAYVELRKTSKSPSLENLAQFVDGTDLALQNHTYTAFTVDDDRMNLSSLQRWDDTNQQFLTYRYTYDELGNRITITDPADNTTRIVFDDTYHTYPQSRISPPDEAGRSLRHLFAYDPRFGLRVAVTDPNGAEDPGEYTRIRCLDGFGRLTASQGPIPARPVGIAPDTNCAPPGSTGSFDVTTARVITLAEHGLANEGTEIFHRTRLLEEWPTDEVPTDEVPDLSVQRHFVDALSRVYRSTRTFSGDEVVVETTFDGESRITSRTLPHFAGEGSFSSRTFYDVYGRVYRAEDPTIDDPEQMTETLRDYRLDDHGEVVTETRAADHETPYIRVLEHRYFNSDQRLVRMAVPDDAAETEYGYDRLGRATAAREPKTAAAPQGLSSTVTFDSLGRRRALENHAQGKVTFHYDPQGRLRRKVDANGEFRFDYDNLGRLIRKTLPVTDQTIIDFHYDETGSTNGLGRRTRVEMRSTLGSVRHCQEPTGDSAPAPHGLPQPLSCYRFDFDKYGNPTRTDLRLASPQDVRRFSSHDLYAPDNSVVRHTYPDGSVLRRERRSGRLHRLTLDGEVVATYLAYDANGQPRQVDLGNGLTARHDYSAMGPPRSQSLAATETDPILDLRYDWDALGQLRQIEDRTPGDTVRHGQSFTYESLRLKTAESATEVYPPLTFGYDASGNLTQKDAITYLYDGNRVLHGCAIEDAGVVVGDLPEGGGAPGATPCADSTLVFDAEYSASGNMIRKKSRSEEWIYQYNAENRLLQAAEQTDASATLFAYDYTGRRLLKTTPGGSETLYVDEIYRIETPPSSAARSTRTVIGSAGPVASITRPEGSEEPGAAIYFHRNHLSSVLMTTDGEGQPVSRLTYRPYGETTVHGPGDSRPKYNAHELDSSSRLYYYGARYYDPEIGRFLTADTGLGAARDRADAFDRYAYALNSPTVFSDPTGNQGCFRTAIAGGLVLGVASGSLGGIAAAGGTDDAGFGLGAGSVGGLALMITTGNGIDRFCQRLREFKRRGSRPADGALGSDSEALNEAGDEPAPEEPPVEDPAVADAENLAVRAAGEERPRRVRRVRRVERRSGRRTVNTDECQCFAAGTQVAVEAGLKLIQDIRPGDRVWSWDAASGRRQLQPVRRLIRKPQGSDQEIRLTVAAQEIVATPEHPFWSVAEQTWMAAGDLRPGDRLMDVAGRAIEIERVESRQRRFEVYNFEVAVNHNYFVGAAQVLVHNASCVGEEDGLGGQTELGTGEVTADADLGGELAADAAAGAEAAAEGAAAASTAEATATAAGAAAAEAGADAAAEIIGEVLLALLLAL